MTNLSNWQEVTVADDGNEILPRDVQGLKYLEVLLPLLDQLHQVGCKRDRAGNRKLHYDQYCLLVLLFLFNPVLRSLRALQQASLLKKVQRKLGVRGHRLVRYPKRRTCSILSGWKGSSDNCC